MQELLSTKGFVDKYDLMAKKSLGQNFLLDSNITDKIINLSLGAQNLTSYEDNNVIEIGPGPAGLTRSALAKNPKSMTVIEMDNRCINILNEIKEFYPQLNIINGDALEFNWKQFSQDNDKYHIVSNLPYNISVVLLTKWLTQINDIKSMTLMFQKEVANRIIADVGTKEYGRISIISQLQCKVIKLFDLPPTCFVPAPKIWSSVLLFTPKADSLDKEILQKIENITKIAFSGRRKMIRQSMKSIPNFIKICEELDIETTLRAEDLSPEDYLQIALKTI